MEKEAEREPGRGPQVKSQAGDRVKSQARDQAAYEIEIKTAGRKNHKTGRKNHKERQETGMEDRIQGQEIRPQEEGGRGRDRPESRGISPTGKKKNTRGISILALPVAVLLTAALTAGFFCLKYQEEAAVQEGLAYEGNIVAGDIPGKSREERQRELDAVVEEGMLAMTINATPSGRAAGADRTVNWLIENPSNQGKLIRVEVWRDDTGEKIYETGAIPPGNYVENAPLLTELPPGEYSCTAKFFAYREDETYIGQAAARIRLVLYE